ncbi:MAG: metal ABC transporter ATP-binding protein [Verrucomicrobiota bacterium]
MSNTLITLDRLAIGYPGQPVLAEVSLEIARSSFTAILGANGTGKSTLLKTLLGLQAPRSGEVRFAGPVTFGYVPQSIQFDTLYPLSGQDVALMGVYGRVGAGRRVPPAERAWTRECLEAVGAGEFARRPFSVLSGGQKQRVLMARALATRANVLVLDEPTAGVDVVATRALMELVVRLQGERGLAVLLVTHDLALVRKHARQVIWLHEGQVLHGPVEQLLTRERLAEIFEMEVG